MDSMNDGVRRLVTGVDGNGKAIFLSDDKVEVTGFSNAPTGAGIAKVWGSNTQPTVPRTEASFDYDTMFPPPPGFRYEVWRAMPDSARSATPLDPEVMAQEMDEKFPGLREHFEQSGSGTHTTQSVDIGVILDGEIWLGLDDGDERLLRAGDIYIQNGTRHTWYNRSEQICTIAVILIGANHQ